MSYKYYSFLVALILVLLLATKLIKLSPPKAELVVTPPPVSGTSEFEVQAWIYPGSPSCDAMTEISDGRTIDTLKAEYFAIDSTGQIVLLTESEAGCNGYSTKNIELIKQFSTNQYVLVSSNHIDMRVLFSDQVKIDTAVNTLVSFVVDHSLSGVEIDFEDFSSWTGNDYSNYMKFTTQLGTQLHLQQKYLMVDGPALTKSTQSLFKWNYGELSQLPIDYLVVMVYDNQYDEGIGSFISPNQWVEQVIKYTQEQVDSSKLIIGVPNYGYHSNSKKQILLDTQEQSSKYPGFATAKESPDSFELYWRSGGDFYLTQTQAGLNKKINLIKTLGINQISIWHLGGNPWFE